MLLEGVMRRLITFIIASFIVLGLAHAPALAQGGSAGGSIGKQGKSVSGEEEKSAPRSRARATKPAGAKVSTTEPRYIGCFKDQQTSNPFAGATTQGRDLNGFITNDAAMTTARCVAVCRSQGFPYAGTQYATYCFCGNKYGQTGTASNCDMACGGNPTEMCGGAAANSIYRISGSTNQ
jgi:hypothetical protein